MEGAVLALDVLAQAGPSRLIGTLVNGLSLGAIYGLLAMGFVIIFKATQVVNFAHGAMATLGAYFTAVVAVDLNFPGRYIQGPPVLRWSVSVLVALALSALVGMLLMTQAGVLAAAKSIEELDFDGVAPTERCAGDPNDIVQRTIWIGRPDPEGLVSGTAGTGTRTIESFYTHPVPADYVFEGACYKIS